MTPDKWWSNRSPAVRLRIERLNPNIFASLEMYAGKKLRGWNPAPTKWVQAIWSDVFGKRQFIGMFGRSAWDKIPKEHLIKSGRRIYVTRYAVLDKIWEAGEPEYV